MNKPILDPCCGSRMFWFNRTDDRAVFGDVREESHQLKARSSKGGSKSMRRSPTKRAISLSRHTARIFCETTSTL